MADTATYDQQGSVLGGDIMEVVMSGGDGAMNEDTLTQVVNMLQMEGQLTQGNHTIIIRQPGSDDVQMIQAMQSDGELILTKASAADVQALQSRGSLSNVNQELVDNSSGQVVMVDEGGNIVEGNLGNVVQIPTTDGQEGTQEQLIGTEAVNGSTVTDQTIKSHDAADILNNLVETSGNTITAVSQQNMIMSTAETPSVMTTHTNVSQIATEGGAYSIKIDTGGTKTRAIRDVKNPDAIVIATTTGKSKYHPPKFHKCEACVINFVSEIAYSNHMESCPNKAKLVGKGVVTYTCVFCETKFATRLALMKHVRLCEKARSSKPNNTNKIRSMDMKGDVIPKSTKIFNDINNKIKKTVGMKQKPGFKPKQESSVVEEDIDNLLEERDVDSDDEDEKNIVYDDDEDINQELLEDDNVEESLAPRKSRKYLGPIVSKGMLKCRDCSRTFSKETQYNRHVNACTMRPLLSGQAQDDETSKNDLAITTKNHFDMKRKREDSEMDLKNPKRANFGPKIVSVDPKKVVAASMKSKPGLIHNESGKTSKITGGSISKIVKITQSDPILKKGKNITKARSVPIGPLCGLCGEKSKSMEELGTHMKMSHAEDVLNLRDSLDGKGQIASIKCALCGVFFSQSHDFMLHLVGAHSSNLNEAQEELLALGLSLPCAFCTTVLPSQPSLLEHISLHHLNKIAGMPSPQSASTYGVDSFLKEKPEEVEASVQESATCPECGIQTLTSFFGHHKCASQKSESGKKLFFCCYDHCEDTFYKLSHLLMHLIQVHEESSACRKEQFETDASFFDWLKKEEQQTKKKYTKSLQRIRSGKLTTVWTCYRFHNSVAEGSTALESLEKNQLCYSRIHAVTEFNLASSRYDGETSIKYYPNCCITKERMASAKSKQKKEASPEKVVDQPAPEQLDTPVTTEEQLQKLLETGDAALPLEGTKSVSSVESSQFSNVNSSTDATDILSGIDTLESTSTSDTTKTDNTIEPCKNTGLMSMTNHEMLEKMLDESMDATPAVPEEIQKPTQEAKEEGTLQNSMLMPTEAKISEDDVLQAFGVSSAADIADCLPSESNSASPNVQTEPPSVPHMDVDNSLQTPEHKPQDVDPEMEESTYVLPADLEEWKKLFELVRTQIETNSLSPEGLAQAQELLPFEDKIATVPIEKQVDVFARLCTLANVSMS